MKKTKKIISLTLVCLLLFSLFVTPAYAEGESETQKAITLDTSLFKTNYPYIFVHGMGGWGTADPYYSESPYWGGNLLPGSENDMIRILNENGVEAYAPSVGPLSSAWDRACELYAQLKGTVVDYGEAHSKAHNHERYGFSYEGKAIMGEDWNFDRKINLVGHSFGGATVRLLASLLAYGSQEEIEATGEETSELFKGGHNCVHSCITLSAPHNGSQVSNLIVDTKIPLFAIAAGLNVVGATLGNDTGVLSLQLSQFGITPKQGEKRAKFSMSKIIKFYTANDNCGYDMTLKGARELNETIKLAPETYYYSYSTACTEPTGLCGRQKGVETMTSIFNFSSKFIAFTEGMTIDGIKIEGNWAVNDGIVPLASGLYPLLDEENAFDYEETLQNGTIEPGKWYYPDTMVGMDHFDFCGTEDYPTSFEEFYFSMVTTANSR